MSVSLDLFSTSQTNHRSKKSPQGKKDRRIYDECLNNAPYFAYQIHEKKWGVVQGCCNNWNCPRCGQQRAREEYARIVVGSREISKSHQLYFLTITCRGKELDLETAERDYPEWTNRLLTRLRAATKRASGEWYYACVTERQKRAHSHFITSYCPPDVAMVKKGEWKSFYTLDSGIWAKHDTLQTEICERAVTECGFGHQYDLSRIESIEAGSRYMAKYLFKESVFETVWPKGWRRVRYSQSWPKLPETETNAFVLLTQFDWYRLSKEAVVVKTTDDGAKAFVTKNLNRSDVIIQ